MESTWIIIPTYNEKDNIEALITAIFALPIPDIQVVIVDDSSPDGTGRLVQNLQSQFPRLHLETRETKNGLGKAYIHGFQYAMKQGANQIVQMDADFSHDPTDIPKLIQALDKHDLVIGSRYKNGISVINWPLKRLLISIGGNLYARLITGLPVQDATGGFKAWRASILRKIDLATIDADGYSFQIATSFRAWKQGARITEVPIIFTERREGQSKMSRAIVLEALWLVWKLRFSPSSSNSK